MSSWMCWTIPWPAIRPQVVSETAAPLAGADILPPSDLPVLASPVASVTDGSSAGTGSSTGQAGASSSASDAVPPPPPPPVIGFGTGADGNDTLGFASSALAAAAKVAAEAPPAEKPPAMYCPAMTPNAGARLSIYRIAAYMSSVEKYGGSA